MSASQPILSILSPSDIRRFWSKVSKAGANECWLWQGSLTGNAGYGGFAIKRPPERWELRPNRVAYALHHQTDPGEQLVCHTCDVHHCCNPAHLFLGSHADNATDMAQKGRGRNGVADHPEAVPRGEQHYNRKLSKEQVNAIRDRHAAGETSTELAQLFGVNSSAIRKIVRRERWAHVI